MADFSTTSDSEIGPALNPPDSEIDHVSSNPPHHKINQDSSNLQSDQTKRKISIMVTGITGCGKSSLVNGILRLNNGKKKAKEGDKTDSACTTKVKKYKHKRENIGIKVWDTPGLLDGKDPEAYLNKMKEKCSRRNLTIHCVKVAETRFVCGNDNPQVKVMKMLTNEFGQAFWKGTIIALTFADAKWVNSNLTKWDRLTKKEKDTAFNEQIKQFKSSIQDVLIHDVQVPKEVVNKIKFAQTGHYSDNNHLNTESWLQDLWNIAVPEPTSPSQSSIIKQPSKERRARYQEEEAGTEDEEKEKLKKRGRIIGSVLGILGGPLMPVTIPAGFYIGKWVGKKIAKNRVKPQRVIDV